jgi:hypothetical protein
MLELGGEHQKKRSPPRRVLERYVLELCVGVVGFFGLGHFLELRLLGPVGPYGAMLSSVALASLLRDHHRLVPLADEVFCVQFLVGSEASILACLEDVPRFGADLHTILDAPVGVVGELEAFVLALSDAVPHLELRAIFIHGFCLHDLQHVAVGRQKLVSLSRQFRHVSFSTFLLVPWSVFQHGPWSFGSSDHVGLLSLLVN